MPSLLIADDDSDHLSLARLALEEGLPGYVIRAVASGHAVLDAYATEPFDVLLLDYRLSDEDGLEVLEKLRRRAKPPPIAIVLTGLGSEDVAAAALRVGADDYLTKSGNYTALLPGVVERAVQRRRLAALEREVEAQRAIEQSKLAFLQSVNHELRTPLTMIVGYAELLARRGCPTDEIPSYCEEIYAHANRLSHLIEQLLEAAMAEPLQSITAASVRTTYVTALVEDAARAAVAANASRDVVVEGEAGATALVDPVLFRRAVDEVLTNALKFSPSSEVVSVSVASEEEVVVVTVNDRGPGIPSDERERVFLPFYRIENDSSITVRGLGLGLSRVRQLVDAQGGRVSIDDAPNGAGASVRLIFPIALASGK